MSPDDHRHFLQGVRLFNERRFFEAHEIWEDVWRPMAAGATREFLQGLIQCSVALEHLRRSNAIGAARVLERAARRLANVPPVCHGVGVAALLRDVTEFISSPSGAPAPVIPLDEPEAGHRQPDAAAPVSEG